MLPRIDAARFYGAGLGRLATVALAFAALGAQAAQEPNPGRDPDAGSYVARDRRLARDPFLRPYVERLKKSTSAESLDRIRAMAEKDLNLLHWSYGMGIRNAWLWGKQEPALIDFFRGRGIDHPDGMSMVLIRALWMDLNGGTSPENSEVSQ